MPGVSLVVLPEKVDRLRASVEADPLNAEALGELREAIRLGGGKPSALETLSEACNVLDGSGRADAATAPMRKPLSKSEHEGLVIHPREKQERHHKLASLLGRVLHLLQGDQAARTVTRVCDSGTDKTYPALDSANKACAGFLGIQSPT